MGHHRLRELIAIVLACAVCCGAAAATASAHSVRSARTHRGCRASTHLKRRRCRRAAHGTRAYRHRHHNRPRPTHRDAPKAARAPSANAVEQPAVIEARVLATPCQNTELTPEAANIETVQTATLCLINQVRARGGELPLRENASLQAAAVEHSQEMVSEDYFAHVSPSGETPLDRVQAAGYIPSEEVGYTVGENIAWGTLQLSTPSAIVAAWVASPEHLANILDASYRDTGMGVVPAAPASLSSGNPGAVYSQTFGVIVE